MLPRRDTKKARRTLVLSALIVFLGETLAGFMMDRAPLEIRFPEVPRIIRLARERGRSPDIAFFGSSRFQSQINASAVEQELAEATNDDLPFVLNAAVGSGDPVTFDFLIAKLLEAGVRPSLAVIEVSPETVSRRNWALGTHLIRQFTWADVLSFLPDVVYSNAVPRLLSTRFIPVYFFRYEFWQWTIEASGLRYLLCCPVNGTNPPKTEAPRYGDVTLAERLILEAGGTRSKLHRFQIGGFAARALERLLERYKSLGVTTILLGVSISSPSRAEYVPEIDAAFLAYMQKLREMHGVYFVDYRNRVPDELFRSAYYTTPQGTLYVSRLLAREVLAPLWRNRGAGTGSFSSDIDITPPNDVQGYLHSEKRGGTAQYADTHRRQ